MARRNASSVSLSLHHTMRTQDREQAEQKDVFRGDQKVRDFSASLAMGLASELTDDAIAHVLGKEAVKAFRFAHEKLHGFVRKTTGEPAFCHSADIALRAVTLTPSNTMARFKRASVAGSGIFKDQASDAQMRSLFFAGTIRNWQLILPDFGTIEGPFQIVALEFSADHAGEVTFELALESAGALSFAVL